MALLQAFRAQVDAHVRFFDHLVELVPARHYIDREEAPANLKYMKKVARAGRPLSLPRMDACPGAPEARPAAAGRARGREGAPARGRQAAQARAAGPRRGAADRAGPAARAGSRGRGARRAQAAAAHRCGAFLAAHFGCLAGAVQSQADWRCAGAPPPVDELRQRLHKRLEVRAPPASPR
jgi:hypothetical protein